MSGNVRVVIKTASVEDRRSSSVHSDYSEDGFLDTDTEDGGGLDDVNGRQKSAGSMSLFMLGRTYRWVSRAKVAAWFKQAFGAPMTPKIIPSTPGGHKKRTPSIHKMREMRNAAIHGQKRAKIFYHLTPRNTPLTLEPDTANMFREESLDDPEPDGAKELVVEVKKMTKWMRSASGVFEEKYLNLLHAKLLDDAMKCQAEIGAPISKARSTGDLYKRFSVEEN